MTTEVDAITPDRAPYDSGKPVPRPAYDNLGQDARTLADVLGRPTLAKTVAAKLGPATTAQLAARIEQIAARASLTAEDQVSADLIDRVVSESLARMAAAADAHRASMRDLLEGDEPDVAELHRERFTGVSRG